MSYIVIATNGIKKRNSSNTGWVSRSLLLSQSGSLIQYNPKIPFDQVLDHDDTRILLDLFIQHEENGKHHSNVKVIDKVDKYNDISVISSDKTIRLRFPSEEIKKRWLQAFRYCLVQLNRHLSALSTRNGKNPVFHRLSSTSDSLLAADDTVLFPNDSDTSKLGIKYKEPLKDHDKSNYFPLLSTRHRDGLQSVRNSTLVKKRLKLSSGGDSMTNLQSESIPFHHSLAHNGLNSTDNVTLHGFQDGDDPEIVEEDGLDAYCTNEGQNEVGSIPLFGASTVEFEAIVGDENDNDDDDDDRNGNNDDLDSTNGFSTSIAQSSGFHHTTASTTSTTSYSKQSSQPSHLSLSLQPQPLLSSQTSQTSEPLQLQQPTHPPSFLNKNMNHLLSIAAIFTAGITTTTWAYNSIFSQSISLSQLQHPSVLSSLSPYHQEYFLKYGYEFDETVNHSTTPSSPIHFITNYLSIFDPQNALSFHFPSYITLPSHTNVQTLDFSSKTTQIKSVNFTTTLLDSEYHSQLLSQWYPSYYHLPPSQEYITTLLNSLNKHYNEYIISQIKRKKHSSPAPQSSKIVPQDALLNYLAIKATLNDAIDQYGLDFISRLLFPSLSASSAAVSTLPTTLSITDKLSTLLTPPILLQDVVSDRGDEIDDLNTNVLSVASVTDTTLLDALFALTVDDIKSIIDKNVQKFNDLRQKINEHATTVHTDSKDTSTTATTAIPFSATNTTSIDDIIIQLFAHSRITLDDIIYFEHFQTNIVPHFSTTSLTPLPSVKSTTYPMISSSITPTKRQLIILNQTILYDLVKTLAYRNHISHQLLNFYTFTVPLSHIHHDDKSFASIINATIPIESTPPHSHSHAISHGNMNRNHDGNVNEELITFSGPHNLSNDSKGSKWSQRSKWSKWPKLSNDEYTKKYTAFRSIQSFIDTYTLSTHVTPPSTSRILYYQYVQPYSMILIPTIVITAVLALLGYFGIKYQDVVLGNIMDQLSWQCGTGLAVSTLLGIGVYLFRTFPFIFSLLNALMCTGISIWSNIEFLMAVMEKITNDESFDTEDQTNYQTHAQISAQISQDYSSYGSYNDSTTAYGTSYTNTNPISPSLVEDNATMVSSGKNSPQDYLSTEIEKNLNTTHLRRKSNLKSQQAQELQPTQHRSSQSVNKISTAPIASNDGKSTRKHAKRHISTQFGSTIDSDAKDDKNDPINDNNSHHNDNDASDSDQDDAYNKSHKRNELFSESSKKSSKGVQSQSHSQSQSKLQVREKNSPIQFEISVSKSRGTIISDENVLKQLHTLFQQQYTAQSSLIIPKYPGSTQLTSDDQKILFYLHHRFPRMLEITDYSWQPGQWKDLGVYDDVFVQKNTALSPKSSSGGSLLARGQKVIPIPPEIMMSLLWFTRTKPDYDSMCIGVEPIHEVNNHITIQRQIYTGQRICNDRFLNVVAGWQRARWSQLSNKSHIETLSIQSNQRSSLLSQAAAVTAATVSKINPADVHSLPLTISSPYWFTTHFEQNELKSTTLHTSYRSRVELFGLYDTTTNFSTFPSALSSSSSSAANHLFNVLPLEQHTMPLPLPQPQQSTIPPLSTAIEFTSVDNGQYPLLDDGFYLMACSPAEDLIAQTAFFKAHPPKSNQTEAFLYAGGFCLRACLIPLNVDQPTPIFSKHCIDHGKKMLKQLPDTTSYLQAAKQNNQRYIIGTLVTGIGHISLPGLASFLQHKVCTSSPGLIKYASKYLLKDSKDPKVNHQPVGVFYA